MRTTLHAATIRYGEAAKAFKEAFFELAALHKAAGNVHQVEAMSGALHHSQSIPRGLCIPVTPGLDIVAEIERRAAELSK